MTEVITTMFPDGQASAPGLSLVSEPTSGFFKKATGEIGVTIAGVEAAVLGANGVLGGLTLSELAFVESGAGTASGTISLPAGSRIVDIGVDGVALWNSAGAASIVVGDAVDGSGFFLATDLKATDLLAGETNNIEHPGGLAGSYIGAEQRVLYQATARAVVATVTVASGSGTLGRTRVYVVHGVSIPVTVTP